jgi:uncharacterized DUF497 family protein
MSVVCPPIPRHARRIRGGPETGERVIGRIDDRCWSAVITVRGGRVRIISVRRARGEEIAIYEGT